MVCSPLLRLPDTMATPAGRGWRHGTSAVIASVPLLVLRALEVQKCKTQWERGVIDSALWQGFLNCLLAGNYAAEQAGHWLPLIISGWHVAVRVCLRRRVISSRWWLVYTNRERETKEGRESVGKTERPHKRLSLHMMLSYVCCISRCRGARGVVCPRPPGSGRGRGGSSSQWWPWLVWARCCWSPSRSPVSDTTPVCQPLVNWVWDQKPAWKHTLITRYDVKHTQIQRKMFTVSAKMENEPKNTN